MADVPFYLQGTQTAGLFGQHQASYPYTPGQGMPLYGDQSSIPSIPRQQTSFDDFYLANKEAGIDGNNSPEAIFKAWQQGGGMSVMPMATASPTAPQEDYFTPNNVVNSLDTGGFDLSPRTQQDTIQVPNSGAATATGGSLGTQQGSFGGGLLTGGNMPQGSSPGVGAFPQFGQSGPSNYMPNGQQQPGAPANGQVSMMQSGAQNGLNQYYNTPGYQLTEGQGAVNQFQAGPGYQYSVDQALGQVQRNAASRGLLDSGAGLRAMTDRAQGMANQEFSNWQNRQQQMYNSYQNRLAGLAGGPTGADQGFMTGQGMASNAMQTGSNIGSLLANQGNSLFGGIVGAGGAQAQNVNQAGNMQAQILGNNLQTQLGAAALGARY